MDVETLERQLLALLRARRIVEDRVLLDLDTDLRDSGALDSIRFVALMAVLEELGAENVDYALEHPEETRTVRQLVSRCF